jgi:hypothetical protein
VKDVSVLDTLFVTIDNGRYPLHGCVSTTGWPLHRRLHKGD